MDPVFVFGTGRCGSTYLQRLISSQSSVWVWGEHGGALAPLLNALEAFETSGPLARNVFERPIDKSEQDFVAALDKNSPQLAWLNGFDRDSLQRELAAALDRLFRIKLPSGWTSWGFKEILYGLNNRAPELLFRLFPGARAAFSFRNPRDTVESMIRTWTPDMLDEPADSRRLRTIWEERVQRWERIMRYFLALRENQERLFFVSLERGLRSPDSVLRLLQLPPSTGRRTFLPNVTNPGPKKELRVDVRQLFDRWYEEKSTNLSSLFDAALRQEQADFATVNGDTEDSLIAERGRKKASLLTRSDQTRPRKARENA